MMKYKINFIKHRRSFILFMALGLLIFIGSSRYLSKIYSVGMTISPVSSSHLFLGQEKASLSDVLTGPLGGSQPPEFSKFLDLIPSRIISERLIQKHGIDRLIYSDRWNPETKKWKEPSFVENIFYSISNLVLNTQQNVRPLIADVQSFLKRKIRVYEFKKSNLTRLSLYTQSPENAMSILSLLHQETDQLLKDIARERTVHEISVIKEKLDSIDQIEHRKVLIDLLKILEQERILTAGDLPFAADIVEPPSMPEQSIAPPTPLLFVLSLLFSFLAWILFLVLRKKYLKSIDLDG